MRHARTLLLATLPALASCAPPAAAPLPAPPRGGEDAEAALVASEQAFEQATIREGVRDGFIRFADDSAVIFRPEPVNAIANFRSRPATKIRLAWHPAFARAARSGDLGFTTGPSQVMDSTGAVVGYGNYVTVWRRGAEAWRWVVDLGTSNPKPEPEAELWTPRRGPPATPAGEPNAAAPARCWPPTERSPRAPSATDWRPRCGASATGGCACCATGPSRTWASPPR